MSKERFMHVLLYVSLFINVLFLASGALYLSYVRSHGGTALFVERFAGASPIALNKTTDSLVRKSLFETLASPASDSPIVFLGDSLTEFCEWNELLRKPVLNRGISSDTTVDVLNRLDPVLSLHPTAIYLMIGTNDGIKESTVEDTADRYRQILEKIRRQSPNTRIYMQSLLPVLSTGSSLRPLGANRAGRLNPWIVEMNTRIKSYADGKWIFYINVHDALLQGSELAPGLTVDGVHLSGAGYLAWKEHVEQIVGS
jgi:lysophospholipase L1-like esterase